MPIACAATDGMCCRSRAWLPRAKGRCACRSGCAAVTAARRDNCKYAHRCRRIPARPAGSAPPLNQRITEISASSQLECNSTNKWRHDPQEQKPRHRAGVAESGGTTRFAAENRHCSRLAIIAKSRVRSALSPGWCRFVLASILTTPRHAAQSFADITQHCLDADSPAAAVTIVSVSAIGCEAGSGNR